MRGSLGACVSRTEAGYGRKGPHPARRHPRQCAPVDAAAGLGEGVAQGGPCARLLVVGVAAAGPLLGGPVDDDEIDGVCGHPGAAQEAGPRLQNRLLHYLWALQRTARGRAGPARQACMPRES